MGSKSKKSHFSCPHLKVYEGRLDALTDSKRLVFFCPPLQSKLCLWLEILLNYFFHNKSMFPFCEISFFKNHNEKLCWCRKLSPLDLETSFLTKWSKLELFLFSLPFLKNSCRKTQCCLFNNVATLIQLNFAAQVCKWWNLFDIGIKLHFAASFAIYFIFSALFIYTYY